MLRSRHLWVAITLACVSIVGRPALAADFDDVVLLANENRFGGYNDVWGFVGNDGREYVIQGTSTGTAWWDVDDPIHPQLVTFLEEPASTWRDMFVIGDRAYIVAENFDMGVRIVDISDPTNPTYVTSYLTTVNQAHNIFGDVARELLFIVGGSSNMANGGLQILDASSPDDLVEIAQWNDKYVHDMATDGNLAYLCLISFDQLQILDLTDPAAPVPLGLYDSTQAQVHACWPAGDGVHLLITHETDGGGLHSIDVSDPMAPTLASVLQAPNTSTHNVHVEGDRAWVSWYSRGTRVVDITDPTSLAEIGHWGTTEMTGLTDGNWGVYPHLPGGVVASNDRRNGLFLLMYDSDAGVLDGVVTPSAGSFAFGAEVEYVDLALTESLEGTGAYAFSAFPGPSQKLRFSAFGFAPDSATVAVPAGGTVTTNVTLAKLPAGSASGVVTDAQSLQPLEGADAIIDGTPLIAVSDASGAWSLPDVPAGTATMTIQRAGYVSKTMTVTIPTAAQLVVDVELEPATVYVDFSNPVGWTEDNDPGVIGTWTFGDPFPTYLDGELFQTGDDHTPGADTDCAITGNFTDGVDDADVDEGATRLLSPTYDLSAMNAPHVLYYRWYAIELPLDPWEVEVSPDGGTTWILIETSTADERFWQGIDIDLTPVLSSFDNVRFRFTAQDGPPETLVEAALDDFTLYDALAGGVSVEPVAAPVAARLALAPVAPNPFASSTAIRFSIPSTGQTSVRVYDVRGTLVATLIERALAPGDHALSWDGRMQGGGVAAAGVYFVEVRHAGAREAVKFIRSR